MVKLETTRITVLEHSLTLSEEEVRRLCRLLHSSKGKQIPTRDDCVFRDILLEKLVPLGEDEDDKSV